MASQNVRSRPSWAVVAPGMAGKFPVFRYDRPEAVFVMVRLGMYSGGIIPGKKDPSTY